MKIFNIILQTNYQKESSKIFTHPDSFKLFFLKHVDELVN